MKFYEFGGNEYYYALIGAETKEEAEKCYYENISYKEICPDLIIKEITREKAIEKYMKAISNSIEYQKEAKELFDYQIKFTNPVLLLVDGSLF